MAETAIEWTDATWNPVTGCDRISPGCENCYALTLAARLKAMGQDRYQRDGDPRTSGPGFGLTLHPDKLAEPGRWRKPRMVFVNSMSDLFHKDVPANYIERVFNVMGSLPRHTFQVLTKRPKRMARVLADYYEITDQEPFPNVWLGTSIESQEYAWRADRLREAPAAVRFISAEPLIGPVDDLDLIGIDWLIVGGESGANHRRFDPNWARSLRAQARANGTAFFFKQHGGRTPKAGGNVLDGKTYQEFPCQPPTERSN